MGAEIPAEPGNTEESEQPPDAPLYIADPDGQLPQCPQGQIWHTTHAPAGGGMVETSRELRGE